MWLLSLCDTKHMIMRHRNEWLAWAATAVGSLGLVGLAAAQRVQQGGWEMASAETAALVMPSPKGITIDHTDRLVHATPITDDGWSADLPMARQVVISRRTATSPLRIDVFNERGEVVDHIDWSGDGSELKPLPLEALVAGRYAIRVTGAERSQVIRFRRD